MSISFLHLTLYVDNILPTFYLKIVYAVLKTSHLTSKPFLSQTADLLIIQMFPVFGCSVLKSLLYIVSQMAKLQKQTQNWEKCWIKKREIFQLEYFCWRISSFGKAVCGKDVAKIIPQQSTGFSPVILTMPKFMKAALQQLCVSCS